LDLAHVEQVVEGALNLKGGGVGRMGVEGRNGDAIRGMGAIGGVIDKREKVF
jgi:hypothetical protein